MTPAPYQRNDRVLVEAEVREPLDADGDYCLVISDDRGQRGFAYVRATAVRSVPIAAEVDDDDLWPRHWTFDAVLEREHARFHDQDGNLLGRDDCEEMRCDFWAAAQHLLHAGLVVRRAGGAA